MKTPKPSEPQRKFKGVWIHKELWLNTNITWMQKCVLAEINSLSDEDGCYASDKYLANFFGVSIGRIRNILTNLRRQDLITSTYNGQQRRLKLAPHVTENVTSPCNEKRDMDVTKSVTSHVTKTVTSPPCSIYEGDSRLDTNRGSSAQSRHPATEFTELWCELYKAHFGKDYLHTGGKDGTQLKILLANGVKVESLMETATQAWSQPHDREHWNCNRAITIAFFCAEFNKIQAELAEKTGVAKKELYPDAVANNGF